MGNADILIIGAGAAGLMAAHELSKSGKKIIVLEARDRIGGRIHTLDEAPYLDGAELGAEFVHGDLPVTLQLLNEAGIDLTPATGEMWYFGNGKFSPGYLQMDHWDLLMEKLDELGRDTSIGDFLQQKFGGEIYTGLRKSVTKYVAGYDTADSFKASAHALRKEWQNEDEGAQHRIKGGYGKMISYLADESKKNGAQIILNAVVKRIHWQHGQVEAITRDGTSYKATKLIVAVPLGVLQADPSSEGYINFSPSIPKYQEAIQKMGFGSIVKILLEFKNAFWEDEETTALAGNSLKEMNFLLSDEEIPTWWTQFPNHSTLLTGWLGGPPAERKKSLSNEELLQLGLTSLSNIFKIDLNKLRGDLTGWNVVNWTTDPFTRGSYAYDTVEASASRKTLNIPINYTLFFAGEYLYDGPAMGTVEAALTSGLEAAKMVT